MFQDQAQAWCFEDSAWLKKIMKIKAFFFQA